VEEVVKDGLNGFKRVCPVPGVSLPKKSYLVAGLFSDYFKTGEVKSTLEPGSKKIPAYKPEDFPNGLLPPPHYCGVQIRKKKRNFQASRSLFFQSKFFTSFLFFNDSINQNGILTFLFITFSYPMICGGSIRTINYPVGIC
jgi:hypothetical protein